MRAAMRTSTRTSERCRRACGCRSSVRTAAAPQATHSVAPLRRAAQTVRLAHTAAAVASRAGNHEVADGDGSNRYLNLTFGELCGLTCHTPHNIEPVARQKPLPNARHQHALDRSVLSVARQSVRCHSPALERNAAAIAPICDQKYAVPCAIRDVDAAPVLHAASNTHLSYVHRKDTLHDASRCAAGRSTTCGRRRRRHSGTASIRTRRMMSYGPFLWRGSMSCTASRVLPLPLWPCHVPLGAVMSCAASA
jgi:hypothetical protein